MVYRGIKALRPLQLIKFPGTTHATTNRIQVHPPLDVDLARCTRVLPCVDLASALH